MLSTPLGIGWPGYLKLRLLKSYTLACVVRNYRIDVGVGSSLELWRCQTYSTKEPETLDWIDSFTAGDVFFDIGANIGLYSLYAAKAGCRVFAFEPEARNYSRLVANIMRNGFDRAAAYCLALSDEEKVDHLFVSGSDPGDSQHSFGSPNEMFPRAGQVPQGCLAMSVDRLCFDFGLPVPNHIKIDVDGIEERILAGARRVLGDPALRTLLVEVAHLDGMPSTIIDTLALHGFRTARVADRAFRSGGIEARNYVFERIA
jgi:FkbM family methyltransferase